MRFSYNKLFKLLIDRGINKKDFTRDERHQCYFRCEARQRRKREHRCSATYMWCFEM